MSMMAYQLQCPREHCSGQISRVHGTDESRCHLCEREFVMVDGWPVEVKPEVGAEKSWPTSKKGDL